MGHFNICEAPHKMPSGSNGLETLYCNVVQHLEQLQLQNLKKAVKKYLQSAEVKDWMRFKRRKPVQMIHPAPHKDPRVDDAEIQEQINRRHSLPSQSVNLKCQAFPKYRNQKVEDNGNRNARNHPNSSTQQERLRDSGPVAVKPSHITSKATSNRKVDRLFNEPVDLPTPLPSSSEFGRFKKSMETMKTYRRSSRATTAVGCETLATTKSSNASTTSKPSFPQVSLPSPETECSNTFFHTRNLKYNYEGTTTPINKLETRPASTTLRRELNCKTLIEEVKRQRALDAKLDLRKRERLSAQIVNDPMAIVILRSNKQHSVSNRNKNMSDSRTRTPINKDKNFTSCIETPTSNYSQAKRFGLEEDEGCKRTTRQSHQIGSERPHSRSMLVSTLAQNSRPFAPANRTTAILQDALEVLECAHRWNEWGARTIHELAKASKAVVERNHSLLDWSRINEPTKPEILLPHDNDIVTSTRRGRVLESREEERVFIRNFLVASGLTTGDWVDKRPLDAKHQLMVKPTQTTRHRQRKQQDFEVPGSVSFERWSIAAQANKKKLMNEHILCDFIGELLKHEMVLQKYAQPGINPTASIHEHERKEQTLVQKVWNNLQTYPTPTSDGIYTTVQLVVERDLKVQNSTSLEVVQVIRKLEDMIYESLVQELLQELKQVATLSDRVQLQSPDGTCINVKV